MNFMQMLNNPQAYAMQMLNQNPQIKNNPVIQNAIHLAQTNNQDALKKIAQNIANANGVDLEQIVRNMQFNK